MKGVMITRKTMARPKVARAGPDMARAIPDMARAALESHRAIFWALGRGQKAEIWHEGGHGHKKAYGQAGGGQGRPGHVQGHPGHGQGHPGEPQVHLLGPGEGLGS